jgi:hypothetical protein
MNVTSLLDHDLKSRMVELYLYSPIHVPGVVLNKFSTSTT